VHIVHRTSLNITNCTNNSERNQRRHDTKWVAGLTAVGFKYLRVAVFIVDISFYSMDAAAIVFEAI
jgi:hypothetical protein